MDVIAPSKEASQLPFSLQETSGEVEIELDQTEVTDGVDYSHLIRRPNAELRDREYLTPDEVEKLLDATKLFHQYQHRNYCFIVLMFRHGLRLSEAINLRWSNVDFKASTIFVRRAKNGKSGIHPLTGKELRALRQLQKEYPGSNWLFNVRPYMIPLKPSGGHSIVRRAGEKAGFSVKVHPHQLRHACGYYLANKGYDLRIIQDYLGHKEIKHTTRYTELAPNKFNDLWNE